MPPLINRIQAAIANPITGINPNNRIPAINFTIFITDAFFTVDNPE
jgi:hypothetical protein